MKEFDYVGDFDKGYAPVKSDGKYNFIDEDGNLLSGDWFDQIYKFMDEEDGYVYYFDFKGYALVKLGEKWYRIDMKGNLLND